MRMLTRLAAECGNNAWPDIAEWKTSAVPGPQQPDSNSCGVFMCMAAELVVRVSKNATAPHRACLICIKTQVQD